MYHRQYNHRQIAVYPHNSIWENNSEVRFSRKGHFWCVMQGTSSAGCATGWRGGKLTEIRYNWLKRPQMISCLLPWYSRRQSRSMRKKNADAGISSAGCDSAQPASLGQQRRRKTLDETGRNTVKNTRNLISTQSCGYWSTPISGPCRTTPKITKFSIPQNKSYPKQIWFVCE